MSAPGDPLRDVVVRRAGNRCAYCQLPAQLQVGGFEVDHILLSCADHFPERIVDCEGRVRQSQMTCYWMANG
jgi:hypothetical protein